jgi:hypothetical protein|nr:MAG TPA: hypothetical protein [Caudoviricetes sp.]
MSAQIKYGYETVKGIAGSQYGIEFNDIVTRSNESDTGKLQFGMAVATGTSEGKSVKVPDTSVIDAKKIEGVVLRAGSTEMDMNGKVQIKQNDTVGILRKGKVWVKLASGATPSYKEKAYVVNSGDEAGKFTNVQGSNIDIGATFYNVSDENIAVIVLD